MLGLRLSTRTPHGSLRQAAPDTPARTADFETEHPVDNGAIRDHHARFVIRSRQRRKLRKPRICWPSRPPEQVPTGQKTAGRTRNGWQYGWQCREPADSCQRSASRRGLGHPETLRSPTTLRSRSARLGVAKPSLNGSGSSQSDSDARDPTLWPRVRHQWVFHAGGCFPATETLNYLKRNSHREPLCQ